MKEIFKKSNVIYVFRHGETDWNREGRLQGHLEISINKQGKLQSKSLALILKRLGIEVLLSSDLKRAQETSQIISDELNLNPIFNPGFREVFLGDGQGKLINEVDFYFGKNFWKKWNNHDPLYDTLRFPNGESKQETDIRVHLSLIHMINLFSNQIIALCTHGFVMKRMLKTYKSKIKNVSNIQNVECIQFNFQEIKTAMIHSSLKET
ncbi:histidine phosphatase superfamily (branch 1) [Leptospira interrogans str. 2003000735]|uniref:histidine phosphatase family protein n=1 Tax=Leptospira interrogans TaxID=173 RepID=UPI00029216E6|nr:histidine phosphatase family protein [Leptospira interrogans]AJR16332.1 phosphoglycerate mutase [Leptospira interrogans serovar Linhai str. 56609]EKN88452.1 histidine phosphatase superfamily (branch 1) [Leptospira interrogans str. 2002000624]EKQ36603.1 histidine phosphatase superfamily (branch 1) [Leptospira interrogans str. 2002000621]EKQ46067.1 histidine phosphatase superfamily (branch 1) [Leptospira interrogans str. 2002000623]EMJ74153.1 histidine phosphatase superfamily (branch 1) [Lept